MYSPFLPNNDTQYQRWREQKLQHYPVYLEDLIVEVHDPRHLTDIEHQAMLERCRKANMAIYAGKTGDDPDRSIPHRMAQQFGLQHLDHNWLADDDGLTSLTVAAADGGAREHYIPYSNRAIQWHTDGYYNAPERQIHALLLHCVQSAPEGGENRLLDHEIAYLHLRDQNPDYIHALMQPDVMTIPARIDGATVARAENVGPVFSVDPLTGDLHMRYTIRGRNVVWKDDPLTLQALAALGDWLECGSNYIFRGKLEPGMGLVSNNVLHDRSGFEDTPQQRRLLYRARFMDRLPGTGVRG
ncbi:MAG: TauD/TfdA family dioxygenase [Gammaproteobacteria bacterium]|nr:TauD/TfdA family dioxygenase [Gammaproteobacteria bacterium]MBU1722526.1 TauD/TfdA family dioxygenase [Gammaproteobacteria bacterium]MBU2004427.1 TauD/TfdA family dioxygenase [Gammaproteobacteria bacterium]